MQEKATRSPKDQRNRLQKRLQRETGRAIADFSMIEDGDRVMVCLSGGKDSYTMLDMLQILQHRAPVNFELIAVNLDQKQPGFPEHVLPDYMAEQGVEFHVLEKTLTASLRRRFRRVKPPVGSARVCGGAFCITSRRSRELPRLPWGTTGMTSWRR